MGIPVFMAPMAGITDKAFREVIYSLGGRYVVTEMISDKALLHNNSKTLQMLDLEGEPEPRIVQIFGSESKLMAQAAKAAVAHGASIIDINMGCPTPKIVRNGEGAALMKNIPLAEEIAASVVKAVNVPVTVKMRLGWDRNEISAPELAVRLTEAGISMITIHARTREQFYAGKADWEWIRIIKGKSSIPIIGNGDITSPEKALEIMKSTGCDGVMIARSALGNPWIIGRTQHYLETGEILPEPKNQEKLKVVLLHLEKLVRYKGEDIGVKEMRKHAAWYIKGMRKAAEYRNLIMQTEKVNRMEEICLRIFEQREPDME